MSSESPILTPPSAASTPRRPVLYCPDRLPDFQVSPAVAVRPIPGKGLGVVAAAALAAGEIVECCPVLVLGPDRRLPGAWSRLHRVMLETVFDDYVFAWTSRHGAIALGWGGLYNHSARPNARTERHVRERRMTIVAERAIAPGEEVTIAYRHVWFAPVDEGVSAR